MPGDSRRAFIVARRIATGGRALLVSVLTVGAPGAPAAPPNIPSIGYLANEPTPDSIPVLRARRLELLRQVVPGVVRATALWNPTSASAAVDLSATQAAARARNVELTSVEVRGDSDFREVVAKIEAQRPQGLIVLADELTLARREPIAAFASRIRLPTVFPLRDFVDAGGLLSYGAVWTDVFRQAAGLVDRILRGARPSELPVTRASRFELVINLRTARALALPIPSSLLQQADRVLQ